GRADFNHDGVVQLHELMRYVRLRYESTFAKGKDGVNVVITPAKEPTTAALTRVADNEVAFCCNGEWYSGTLVGPEGKKYRVHCDGFDNDEKSKQWSMQSVYARDYLVLPGDDKPLLVEWHGKWYCATLVGKDGENFKVHYVGYAENKDETV